MVEPLGPRLCIKPDKMEDDKQYQSATKAGILIAKTESQQREEASIDRGIVLSIGQSAFIDFKTDPWCEVGDYIAYAKFSGKLVTDPETDEKVLIINDEDVVARLSKKESKND